MSSFSRTQLRHLSTIPITNGLGLAGSNDNPSWPRYIRTTDIASPTGLRDDVFSSQPPEIAAAALLVPGDLLMTAAGASIGKSLRFDESYSACYAGFLVRLRPRSTDEGRYLGYWMQSKDYWDQIAVGAVKSTIDNFSASRYRALSVPLPQLDEQRAIADYLDQETAQIDALVAKQEEFVGLLLERRLQAREVLASRVAVGERLRWKIREIDERAGSRANDLPLFSVSIDWGVRRRDETTERLSRAEDLDHYKVCHEGDIVVNRMRAFQGALGVAPSDGIVSPDYAVVRVASDVDPGWLSELMRTKVFVSEIVLRLRGIGGTDSGNVRTPRINTADLLDIRADIPALKTQRSELSDIVRETRRIDTLIAKANEHIALAKERRSALITAAVTGQLDVRTARRGA